MQAHDDLVCQSPVIKSEKKERHDVKLLIMLRYSLHGLCAFPNMVSSVNLMRKSGIIRRKE